jgi:putative ABC transport system permease protein
MADLLADVPLRSRSLARAPGFAIVAVLTLALGIGANSAIFSVLNGVVLRPLPYGEPESSCAWRAAVSGAGLRQVLDLAAGVLRAEGADALVQLVRRIPYRHGECGRRRRAAARDVVDRDADLFETLGVPALLGRAFTAEEDVPGGEPVVTLSYELWQRAFGGDPGSSAARSS